MFVRASRWRLPAFTEKLCDKIVGRLVDARDAVETQIDFILKTVWAWNRRKKTETLLAPFFWLSKTGAIVCEACPTASAELMQ